MTPQNTHRIPTYWVDSSSVAMVEVAMVEVAMVEFAMVEVAMVEEPRQ